MKTVIVLLLLSSSLLFAGQVPNLSTDVKATKVDCVEYEKMYDKHLKRFQSGQNKKTAIYMVKSYQDDILRYCGRYIDISFYKKQQSNVNTAYMNYH